MWVLGIAQVFIGGLFFLWFSAMRKRAPADAGSPEIQNFVIFKKNNRLIAIAEVQTFQRWAGLLYAAGFFFLAPILIWRYGVLKTLFLLAIPAAGAGVGKFLFFDSGAAGYFFGMLIALILRGFIGVFIGNRDMRYYRDTLLSRGWNFVGVELAKSKKLAVEHYGSR